MKKKANKLWRQVGLAVVMLTAGCLATASCSSGGDDPSPAPTLTVTPKELIFEGTAGNTRTVNITSNASWSVNVQSVPWLQIDYASGSNNATVNFTTTEENLTNKDREARVLVLANNESGSVTDTIKVVQKGFYPDGCDIDVSGEVGSELDLSYGFSRRMKYGNNVKYFKWHVYEETEYSNRLQGDNTKIEEAAASWERITPEVGSECVITYDQCQPGVNYMLLVIPYTSASKRGPLLEEPVYTINSLDQPAPRVKNLTIEDGQYKWDVERGPNCEKYYTYACAGSREFKTFADGKNKTQNVRGVQLAWELSKEMKFNSETHNNTSFNGASDNNSAHDCFYASRPNDGSNSMTARSDDGYLEIMVWGEKNNKLSGLVYDVLFYVRNGKLEPVAAFDDEALLKLPDEWELKANGVSPELTFGFDKEGGEQSVSVTSNDSWTVTTSASDWCHLSSTGGTGNGSFNIRVTQNSQSRRTATVILKGTNSGLTVTITVVQAGATPPSEFEIDGYGSDSELDGGSTGFGRDDYGGDSSLD